MKQTTRTLVIGIVTAVVVTGCGITKGYKQPAKATNSTIEGSLKMSQLSEKAGCDRGVFIVEAMKDKTTESGGLRIQGGGFATKEPMKPGEAYMVLSDGRKPKDFKEPTLADLGGNIPVTIGAELDAPTISAMDASPATISASMNALTLDPAAASTKVADAKSSPGVEFNRAANGKYYAKSDTQSLGGVNTSQVKKFALARTASAATAQVGVGPIKSTMFGATAIGYGGFVFPTDVESPSAEISSVGGNVKDGFSVKLAPAAKIPGTFSFLTVEVRNYPPTNSAKDWRAVYRVEEPEATADFEFKVPAGEKLKEGKVVVDVTRSSLATPTASDANGKVCVETRSTTRVYGDIGKAPAS